MNKNKKVRAVNHRIFKFFMNLYPPLLVNRARIKYVAQDYSELIVILKKSIINRNMAGTIFGGSIFSAADPFHAVMYWQIFAKRYNMNVRVWLKSAEISYKRPSETDLTYQFIISDEDVEKAKKNLDEKGRYFVTHTVDAKNKKNEVCAVVNLTTYIGLKELDKRK